jgi:YfiH family protein
MIPFSPFPNILGGFVGRNQSGLEILELRPQDFLQLKQIHSDRIFCITQKEDLPQINRAEGDAIISTLKNIPIAVRAADCVPILIAHPAGVIAAVHSGWKGTKAQVLKKTLLKMQNEYNLDLSQAYICLGPSICGDCYEVGEEVVTEFKGDLPPTPSFVKRGGTGKFLLDLKLVNQQMALELGVPLHQIEARKECTLCDEKDFFSYRGEIRRGEKGEGRNYAWIMMPRPPQSPES